MDSQQYKLLTLTDGQQVLVTEAQGMQVDCGLMTDDGPVTVATSQVLDVSDDEYLNLAEQAMTNTIDTGTIGEKAQAVMDTETPINEPTPVDVQPAEPQVVVVPDLPIENTDKEQV